MIPLPPACGWRLCACQVQLRRSPALEIRKAPFCQDKRDLFYPQDLALFLSFCTMSGGVVFVAMISSCS